MSSRVENGPLQIGARFLDKYEIAGQVGRGGQAWVYLGKHLFTGREVAIKVIHSPYGVTQEMLVRGKAEARALGKLDHPNIVVMHDAGVTDDGLFYIVMELLRGRTFRAVLAAHGRLEVEEVLRLAIQAGEAVHAAHEVQMIHRDLKPDNIYLTRDNRLKVLDFGIAKMLDEIGFTTRKDVVAGTLLYMSPEQAQGLPLTSRSDICALGLIMFEALIGKHPTLLVFERDLAERNEPYRRATLADIPPIQVNRMPPMLSELDRSIPIYVAQAVQRAIAKVAKQRFSTMADFVAAMRVCLETYLREAPRDRRPTTRDLSLAAPPASDAPKPSPQRSTEKAGPPAVRPQDISSSPPVDVDTAPLGTWLPSSSPVGPRVEATSQQPSDEPAPVTRKAKPAHSMPAPAPHLAAAWAVKPATPPPVAVAPRDAGRQLTQRSPNRILRNAIVAGVVFGATLGTVGAQAYFGSLSRPTFATSGNGTAAAQRPAVPALATTQLAAAGPELSVAPERQPLPLPVASAVARAVPLPAATATPTRSVAPIAHSTITTARAPDKMDQRMQQLETDLGSPATRPSKKAIYGD